MSVLGKWRLAPECTGCTKMRTDRRGRSYCVAIKEPTYFWRKYGSCPGYAAAGPDGEAACESRLAAAGAGKERGPSVKAG